MMNWYGCSRPACSRLFVVCAPTNLTDDAVELIWTDQVVYAPDLTVYALTQS